MTSAKVKDTYTLKNEHISTFRLFDDIRLTNHYMKIKTIDQIYFDKYDLLLIGRISESITVFISCIL